MKTNILKKEIIEVSECITLAMLDGKLKQASNLRLLLNSYIDQALKIERLKNGFKNGYTC